jgi:hypothetical protein
MKGQLGFIININFHRLKGTNLTVNHVRVHPQANEIHNEMNDEYRSLESQFFPFVFVSLLAKQVPWTLDTCTKRKWQQQTENTPKIILTPPRQRKRTPNSGKPISNTSIY